MLSIFATTEFISTINEIIALEDRLDELVTVYDSMEKMPAASGTSLVIDSRGILQPIDWQNMSPPYLISNPLALTKETLLGLIFNKLGNGEKAWSYLNGNELLQFDISMMTKLQHGYQIGVEEFPAMLSLVDTENIFERYRIQHNAAIIHQYGYLDQQIQFQVIQKFYQDALEQAPNEEYKAFTTKHFASLLLDTNELKEAERILETNIPNAISDDAIHGLKSVLTNVWMKQLTVPYDEKLLEKLKNTIWEVLQYFEKNNRTAEAGLLLVDAAHIANISESFSESLGYITKAIRYFDEEELEELSGNAQLRKGTLLYTWAQNGNPQFYNPAVKAYQEALKIFRKAVAPAVFADIHHNLGVLYAEMPADNKKRGIWAGVSSASFQEALNYYTKETHPYEYGMICNNHGNALTKFPPAIHSDNYEKALFYYQEALSVRTQQYPYERAISLLNFLEASWNVGNASDDFNEERYADMLVKAQEISTLTKEKDMLEEADKHLDLLAKLKEAVS